MKRLTAASDLRFRFPAMLAHEKKLFCGHVGWFGLFLSAAGESGQTVQKSHTSIKWVLVCGRSQSRFTLASVSAATNGCVPGGYASAAALRAALRELRALRSVNIRSTL